MEVQIQHCKNMLDALRNKTNQCEQATNNAVADITWGNIRWLTDTSQALMVAYYDYQRSLDDLQRLQKEALDRERYDN